MHAFFKKPFNFIRFLHTHGTLYRSDEFSARTTRCIWLQFFHRFDLCRYTLYLTVHIASVGTATKQDLLSQMVLGTIFVYFKSRNNLIKTVVS